MGDLGHRDATGTISNDGMNPYGNGNWVVTFDPKIIAVPTGGFEVYHLALKGPLGSSMQMYVDRTFYDITNHGDVNSWDPNNTLHLIGGGQTLYLYWNSAVLPVPAVTIYLRQSAALENPIT